MKQLARYTINFESKWIRFCAGFMGFAIFFEALNFFVLNKPQDANAVNLIFFLILPVVLELTWIILLHNVKWNAAGIYGILATLACVILIIQVFLCGNTIQIILGIVAYLLGSALILMITGGFFPYKYFGIAWFALIFLVRFLCFDRNVLSDDWTAFIARVAGLCMIAAISLFFGGIAGVRNKA